MARLNRKNGFRPTRRGGANAQRWQAYTPTPVVEHYRRDLATTKRIMQQIHSNGICMVPMPEEVVERDGALVPKLGTKTALLDNGTLPEAAFEIAETVRWNLTLRPRLEAARLARAHAEELRRWRNQSHRPITNNIGDAMRRSA